MSIGFIPINPLSPGEAGLILTYSILLLSSFQWGVRQSAEVENLVCNNSILLCTLIIPSVIFVSTTGSLRVCPEFMPFRQNKCHSFKYLCRFLFCVGSFIESLLDESVSLSDF